MKRGEIEFCDWSYVNIDGKRFHVEGEYDPEGVGYSGKLTIHLLKIVLDQLTDEFGVGEHSEIEIEHCIKVIQWCCTAEDWDPLCDCSVSEFFKANSNLG